MIANLINNLKIDIVKIILLFVYELKSIASRSCCRINVLKLLCRSSFLRLVGSLFHKTALLNVTDLCRKLVSGLGITNFSDLLKLISFFVIMF